MAGFGIAGLTETGLQQVIDARYLTTGILSGCAVTGSATSMSYPIGAGVVVVSPAAGRKAEILVGSTSVATAAAPSSGQRTDYIVSNLSGVVSVRTTPPGVGETLLKRVIVPAGISNTAAAQFTTDVVKAIAVGQTLGDLVRWKDDVTNGTWAATVDFRWCIFTLPVLPSDRWVDIQVIHALHVSSDLNQGSFSVSDPARAGVQYTLKVDGAIPTDGSREMPVYPWWDTRSDFVTRVKLTGGVTHTLEVWRKQNWLNQGRVLHHVGGGLNVVDVDRA